MKQYKESNQEIAAPKTVAKDKNTEYLENQYRSLLQRVEDQSQTIEKLKRDIARLKDSINILARK